MSELWIDRYTNSQTFDKALGEVASEVAQLIVERATPLAAAAHDDRKAALAYGMEIARAFLISQGMIPADTPQLRIESMHIGIDGTNPEIKVGFVELRAKRP